MSTQRDIGKLTFATKVHKYGIQETFGIKTCETNFHQIHLMGMIERLLTWNDNQTYNQLTPTEVTCMESALISIVNCT